jgi:hypothetical protein
MNLLYFVYGKNVLCRLAGLFLLFVFAICPVRAMTYHVTPSETSGGDGSPGGDGSSGAPWDITGLCNALYSDQIAPGDTVDIQGGHSYNMTNDSSGTGEKMYFTSNEQGTESQPITIQSEPGTGTATLVATSSNPIIWIESAGGLVINNLIMTGAGNGTDGIYCQSEDGSAPSGIQINNVEISGWAYSGLHVYIPPNTSSHFKDISVTNCSFHGNLVGGITIGGPLGSISNVTVKNCTAYSNPGTSDSSELGKCTGNGIFLGGVSGGLIEGCVAYDNGADNICSSGPVGIWCSDSDNVVIQGNESYCNHSAGGDGGGFDIDGGSTNCVMQYNYSHENDAAGFLCAQYVMETASWANNVIRYNISQNDARANEGYGGIEIADNDPGNGETAPMQNCQIYNNVVYMDNAGATDTAAFLGRGPYQNVIVNNNIFMTTGSVRQVALANYSSTTNIQFEGNDYWTSGGGFNCQAWAGSTDDGSPGYPSLTAWQGLGQEENGSTPTGLNVDPSLASPGDGPTVLFSDLPNMAAHLASHYELQPDSPLINAGQLLPALTSTEEPASVHPPQDFFGNALPIGAPLDIGPHQPAAGMELLQNAFTDLFSGTTLSSWWSSTSVTGSGPGGGALSPVTTVNNELQLTTDTPTASHNYIARWIQAAATNYSYINNTETFQATVTGISNTSGSNNYSGFSLYLVGGDASSNDLRAEVPAYTAPSVIQLVFTNNGTPGNYVVQVIGKEQEPNENPGSGDSGSFASDPIYLPTGFTLTNGATVGFTITNNGAGNDSTLTFYCGGTTQTVTVPASFNDYFSPTANDTSSGNVYLYLMARTDNNNTSNMVTFSQCSAAP